MTLLGHTGDRRRSERGEPKLCQANESLAVQPFSTLVLSYEASIYMRYVTNHTLRSYGMKHGTVTSLLQSVNEK